MRYNAEERAALTAQFLAKVEADMREEQLIEALKPTPPRPPRQGRVLVYDSQGHERWLPRDEADRSQRANIFHSGSAFGVVGGSVPSDPDEYAERVLGPNWREVQNRDT